CSATKTDIPAITHIRNEAIEEKIATLDESKHTPEYEENWLNDHVFPYGVWIAKEHKNLLGWTSLNKFSTRPAYKYVADLSVYVSRTSRGKGIGTLLLDFIVKTAKKNGFHKIVLSGFAFNTPAMALYKKFGFRDVGIYLEQGKLNGEWVNVILMEKLL
ncbi:MAG: N-acetyltransferase, partial [Patescibacteria group bacterium]|nr:N-acetyltransferase [Patescibacteria group bacterium]